MTKEEFYRTIKVTPMNLVSSHTEMGKDFEKYDSWELLLSSYAEGKYVYARIKCNPKEAGKDLIELEVLQNEIDNCKEELYSIFLEEMKKEEEG